MSGASNNGSCVSTTIVSLRRVQLTRSSIVAQLHRTNISDAIAGLYVRVLLELENGGEEYKIARILDVQQGAEYSGFTYDTMVTTDRYLVLELSPPAKIDNHYQLNSVSNKEFQHTEYQAWQRDVSLGRLSNPTDVELHTTLIEKIRMLGSGANIPSMASAGSLIPPNTPSSANAIQPRVQSNICLNNNDPSGSNPSIAVNGRQPTRSVFTPSGAAAPLSHHRNLNAAPHVANSSSTAVDEDSSESDYDQSDDELRRSAEEELREQHFVIPKELLVQSTQELRRLDRDVGEYIEKIRENLEQNSTKCIACMVHDPAVIILPCKHKVLCRGCCTKVLICPMCRKKIREVFEPVEM